jgi:hypothetical protein
MNDKVPQSGRMIRGLVAIALAFVGGAALASPDAPLAEWRTVEVFPQGSESRTHPVKISVQAMVYAKDGHGKELARGSAAPDEAFLASVLETYRSGTIDSLLRLWRPEERAHKRSTVEAGNGAIFRKNQDVHKKLARAEILAKVFYGDFVLFGVRYYMAQGGDTYTLIYPVVARDRQYFLTDGLSDDPVFVYLINRVVRELSGIEGGRDLP